MSSSSLWLKLRCCASSEPCRQSPSQLEDSGDVEVEEEVDCAGLAWGDEEPEDASSGGEKGGEEDVEEGELGRVLKTKAGRCEAPAVTSGAGALSKEVTVTGERSEGSIKQRECQGSLAGSFTSVSFSSITSCRYHSSLCLRLFSASIISTIWASEHRFISS